MEPIAALQQEHRLIEQVLDCLEQMAARVLRGHALDREDAAQALDFFRGFTDRCHHGKEEHRLFPALEKRGVPRRIGLLAVLEAEHDHGRTAVRAMAAALAAGDELAFARHVGTYLDLVRDHIAREDDVLLPLAEVVLAGDEAALWRAFQRFESRHLGAETRAAMIALADRLAVRYGVLPAAQRRQRPFLGRCHMSEHAHATG